jgi:hypothetical protein
MKWIIGTSAVIGLAILALGLTLVFKGSLGTENPDDTTKLASALITRGNGTSEGIQIHGDWIIEVSDPDGTLVERREFKNEFTGADAIATILSSEKRVGFYKMMLITPKGILSIHEPTDLLPIWGSTTLTASNGGDGKLILQGE